MHVNRVCLYVDAHTQHKTKHKKYLLSKPNFISPPQNDSFQEGLCFSGTYFLFSPRVISELCSPIAAKFCTILGSVFDFIIPVQNFKGASQKNFRGQKHAEFGLISDDFKVRRRISPERMKMFKIGELLDIPQFLQHSKKKVQ